MISSTETPKLRHMERGGSALGVLWGRRGERETSWNLTAINNIPLTWGHHNHTSHTKTLKIQKIEYDDLQIRVSKRGWKLSGNGWGCTVHCGVERAPALFVSSSSVFSDQMTWALKWPVTFFAPSPRSDRVKAVTLIPLLIFHNSQTKYWIGALFH